MLPGGLFYFTKKEVRKLKIKKVDDKPMVIHTKQKAEIHTHEPKQASSRRMTQSQPVKQANSESLQVLF